MRLEVRADNELFLRLDEHPASAVNDWSAQQRIGEENSRQICIHIQ